MQSHSEGSVGTRVLYEDDETRVWLLELEAGASSDWHVHRTDYLYVVTKGGVVRTEYADDPGLEQTDKVGDAVYRSADRPHRLVNLGGSYQNIVVEFL